MRKTNQMKVIEISVREGNWLPAYDFEKRHDIFVGHRGPARISEVANLYPQMIETDKSKKVYRYRFRVENTAEFMPFIPESWRILIRETLTKIGRHYKVYEEKPVFLESGAVRFEKVLVEK